MDRTTVKRRKRMVTYITVEREVVSVGPAYTALAEVLRSQRAIAGLTQEGLAKLMSMSRPSLANIEAGRQRIPFGDIFDFARALKIEPKKLFALVEAEMTFHTGS